MTRQQQNQLSSSPVSPPSLISIPPGSLPTHTTELGWYILYNRINTASNSSPVRSCRSLIRSPSIVRECPLISEWCPSNIWTGLRGLTLWYVGMEEVDIWSGNKKVIWWIIERMMSEINWLTKKKQVQTTVHINRNAHLYVLAIRNILAYFDIASYLMTPVDYGEKKFN